MDRQIAAFDVVSTRTEFEPNQGYVAKLLMIPTLFPPVMLFMVTSFLFLPAKADGETSAFGEGLRFD